MSDKHGTACLASPADLDDTGLAETYAEAWNAWAEHRSVRAAGAVERSEGRITWAYLARVGGVSARSLMVDGHSMRTAREHDRGYFGPGLVRVGLGRFLRRQSGMVEPGWFIERCRRQDAASTASGTGWQTIAGDNVMEVMAGLCERVGCVTPAGQAALAGFVGRETMRDHGWTWDLDLAVRPGESGRYMRGSEDGLRERERGSANDLHDLSRCPCMTCSRERQEARERAAAVVVLVLAAEARERGEAPAPARASVEDIARWSDDLRRGEV